MIQYQILKTNFAKTVWQTVRRITNEILGVKGLKDLFLFNHIKQIDSMLWVCSVIDQKRHNTVLRTSVIHSWVAPCVSLFCSYHILMSSAVIYYWTDARQLEIYLICNWKALGAYSRKSSSYWCLSLRRKKFCYNNL